jgi:hypothetical protein
MKSDLPDTTGLYAKVSAVCNDLRRGHFSEGERLHCRRLTPDLAHRRNALTHFEGVHGLSFGDVARTCTERPENVWSAAAAISLAVLNSCATDLRESALPRGQLGGVLRDIDW